jgi:DNA-binding transcriptional MerR regulator
MFTPEQDVLIINALNERFSLSEICLILFEQGFGSAEKEAKEQINYTEKELKKRIKQLQTLGKLE